MCKQDIIVCVTLVVSIVALFVAGMRDLKALPHGTVKESHV